MVKKIKFFSKLGQQIPLASSVSNAVSYTASQVTPNLHRMLTDSTGINPDRSRDTNDSVLLWGVLLIKIVRCRKLRNLDGFMDKSDPYVTVTIDDTRIIKTRTINKNLNPLFDEEYMCYVAHETNGIHFKVYDKDICTADDTLGEYFQPAAELIEEVDDEDLFNDMNLKPGQLRRVGLHKEVYLSGKKKYGSLEFFVEFTPSNLLGKTMEVPGIYFKKTVGNDVKFYVNADDDGTAPKVTYGGENDDEKTFEPRRLWREIYDAICGAEHMVYVVGWSVDVDQYLLRGEELDEALMQNKYSPRIGELLKAKAEEGVTVNMMVWDDFSSTFISPHGKMGTHDEKTRNFFNGTKVNAEFLPTVGDETNTIWQGQNKKMTFTHHQKFVVVDAKKLDGSGEKELLAFVGGIDLTEGRWDNRQHPLFRGLSTIHKGDVYNKCFRFNNKSVGPRQPWHDIHSSVRGPEAVHIVRAFHERWIKQVSRKAAKLINLESLGFNMQTLANEGGWHCQLSRSIDARTNEFDATVFQTFKNRCVDELKGVAAEWEVMSEENSVSCRRYDTTTEFDLQFDRLLDQKKGRAVDKSIHITNIHHIRRAKHFIYIESQYFLGSSHMWLNGIDRKVKCNNLIAAELTYKICDKIEHGERFAAYILLPMWCEGLPDGGPNQEILFWQWSTINAMYSKVQDAIDRRCRTTSDQGLEVSDYLNFYCLGNRETPDGSDAVGAPTSNDEIHLSKTRRHQIYIHSKFMIVDDEVALIGTANINQRSMDGCRDTEIMMTSWHPDHLATEESIPKGDVHGYRMHAWASITNEMHDSFRDPKSLECVRRMNEIAESNWQKYIGDEVVEMESHLMPLPLEFYGSSMGVLARKELTNGAFTDTNAQVKGKKSLVLPDIILT